MASETFATRAELRRRLRAKMGASTSDSVQVQTIEMINELLREAAQTVRDKCEWKRLVVEGFFDTGVDQRYYNYLPNSGPGDVVRLWLWNGDANGGSYIPLFKRDIMPNLDNDPVLIGAPETATQSQPVIWQESSQQVAGVPVPAIELNPIPDAVYHLKIEYTQGAQLTDDTTPCIVDADCIVNLAMAEVLDGKGQDKRADKVRAKAYARIALLAGAQRVAGNRTVGLGETLRLKNGVRYRVPPNFDTSLSVMPSP